MKNALIGIFILLSGSHAFANICSLDSKISDLSSFKIAFVNDFTKYDLVKYTANHVDRIDLKNGRQVSIAEEIVLFLSPFTGVELRDGVYLNPTKSIFVCTAASIDAADRITSPGLLVTDHTINFNESCPIARLFNVDNLNVSTLVRNLGKKFVMKTECR